MTVDRLSDWLNPILVKETRQSLKSRQFVATFFLVLVASWLISVFGIVTAGPGIEYKAAGRYFFQFYYLVLAFAIYLAVPFGAFRSLLSERDLHTWEVLSITTLKPRQIVWGKLTSAVVQLFIYYSAITPFIAFANLLTGIDVPTIAFVLVASMFWSLALSMMALTASTFGSQKYWQVFLTLAVLGGLVSGMISSMSIVGFGVNAAFEFDQPEFWWAVGVIASYVAAYCILFLQIAVAQLTFDADNRSSGIRAASAGIFWLSLAWLSGLLVFGGAGGLPSVPTAGLDELLTALIVAGGLHWFAVGLFAATESDILSRRVRRNLQRYGGFRLLLAPLVPGGSRGLVFVIAHISVLFLFVAGVQQFFGVSSTSTELVPFAAGMWCYIVIYLGFGAALGRAARAISGDFRPAHTRVLTVLGLAIGSILPWTLYFFDSVRISQSRNAALFVTDPFSTLTALASGNANTGVILVILIAAAVAAIVINLRAMLTGFVDVGKAYVPPAPSMSREATPVVVT